jgi:hypothetical protein
MLQQQVLSFLNTNHLLSSKLIQKVSVIILWTCNQMYCLFSIQVLLFE